MTSLHVDGEDNPTASAFQGAIQVQVSLYPRYSGYTSDSLWICSHSAVNSLQVVGISQPFSSNISLLYRMPAQFATYGRP